MATSFINPPKKKGKKGRNGTFKLIKQLFSLGFKNIMFYQGIKGRCSRSMYCISLSLTQVFCNNVFMLYSLGWTRELVAFYMQHKSGGAIITLLLPSYSCMPVTHSCPGLSSCYQISDQLAWNFVWI